MKIIAGCLLCKHTVVETSFNFNYDCCLFCVHFKVSIKLRCCLFGYLLNTHESVAVAALFSYFIVDCNDVTDTACELVVKMCRDIGE